MVCTFARIGIVVALLNGTAAFAFDNRLSHIRLANYNPLDHGPLADFLNIFRQQVIPRRVVAWDRGHKPGTVIISTAERRLYYVLAGEEAIEYGVGVGRDGFTWSGTKTVSMKREWPDWSPPPQMLKRRPDLPRHMPETATAAQLPALTRVLAVPVFWGAKTGIIKERSAWVFDASLSRAIG
jgi:hypothetical protein